MVGRDKILRIFVSSPSDVQEERDSVDKVVQEFNDAHTQRTGIHLEVFRWDQHVTPGFGPDAQTVINEQTPPYDIFLGILWLRVGSPTPRAESGTIEEFDRAKARYDQDPESVRPMLYFKTALPPSLKDMDPVQYQGVRAFQERVNREGGLYTEFATAEEFANRIRVDLPKYVLAQSRNKKEEVVSADEAKPVAELQEEAQAYEEDPLGLIELEESLEKETDALTDVLGSIGRAMEDIASSIKRRTDVLVSVQEKIKKKDSARQNKRRARAEVKQILRETAGDMDRFVERMEPQLPVFQHHLDQLTMISAKAIPIYLEINEDNTELKEGISQMLRSMEDSLTAMGEFHDAVHRLPKISTDVIRAGKRVEGIVQETIDIMQGGKVSLEGVLSLFALTQTCPIYEIPAEITQGDGDWQVVYFPQSGDHYRLSRRAEIVLNNMGERNKEGILDGIKEWIKKQRDRGVTSPMVKETTIEDIQKRLGGENTLTKAD